MPGVRLLGDQEPVLQEGASGARVRQLQQMLTERGYDTRGIDGRFGPNTTEAVKRFQSDHGLDPDGIVGPLTWAALMSQPSMPSPGTAPARSAPAPAPVRPTVGVQVGLWIVAGLAFVALLFGRRR